MHALQVSQVILVALSLLLKPAIHAVFFLPYSFAASILIHSVWMLRTSGKGTKVRPESCNSWPSQSKIFALLLPLFLHLMPEAFSCRFEVEKDTRNNFFVLIYPNALSSVGQETLVWLEPAELFAFIRVTSTCTSWELCVCHCFLAVPGSTEECLCICTRAASN